jgi:hypothetical protein
MASMGYGHKAVTIQGVVKVLRASELLEPVRARVTPEIRAVLDDPHRERMHPGQVLDAALTAVFELRDARTVEQVMYRATEQSLSGIVGPLARIYMTAVGGGPRAILQRFETLVSGAGSGFRIAWKDSGPKSGSLTMPRTRRRRRSQSPRGRESSSFCSPSPR